MTKLCSTIPLDVLDLWRPPVRVSPSEWCQLHVMLSALSSEIAGRFNLDLYPFLKEPLDALADDDVQEMTLMFGSQAGKTTLLICLILYWAAVDPGPALLCGDTADGVKELTTTRLYPMLKICARTRDLLPKRERDQLDLLIDLKRMLVFTGWSGSVSKLGSKNIRYLLCFEIDKWSYDKSLEGDSLELAKNRTKAFTRRKHVYDSTPSVKGQSRIEASYDLSDRRRYHVPCPHCGLWHTLDFEALHWPKGADGHSVAPEIARDNAWMECPGCQGRIEDVHKPMMLRRGIWLCAGESARPATPAEVKKAKNVREAYDGTPLFVEGEPEHPVRYHRGYRLSSLYSPALSFGEIASKWLAAGDDLSKKQDFWNGWLARTWEVRSDAPHWKDLWLRLRTDIPSGFIPPEAKCILAGADVHAHNVHYILRAWNIEGKSWLVTHGILASLDEFENVVRTKRFPIFGSEVEMPISGTLVDARYTTNDVDDYCIACGPAVRAIMGDGIRKGPHFKPFPVETNPRTGKVMPHGFRHWHLNSDYYKERVQQHQRRAADASSAWLLNDEEDELYLREVTAEGRYKSYDSQHREIYKWIITDRFVGNHYFDCECYIMAGFDMWRRGWGRAPAQRRRHIRPRRLGL